MVLKDKNEAPAPSPAVFKLGLQATSSQRQESDARPCEKAQGVGSAIRVGPRGQTSVVLENRESGGGKGEMGRSRR